MEPTSLFDRYRAPELKLGNYTFVSQDGSIIKPSDLTRSATAYVPAFIRIWQAIEKTTGYRWKCTSYIRDSFTHKSGQAFDLAPDFAADSFHLYAANRRSDPVLYKREPLVFALQKLKDRSFGGSAFDMGIFIEPDHLHIQVLAPSPSGPPTSVIKWQVAKPVYPDTFQRMEVPVFKA